MSGDIPPKVVGLVPNVFYDLIARLVPGFVVIASSYVAFVGPSKAMDALKVLLKPGGVSGSSLVVVALLLGVASYLLAMLLSGVSHWVKLKERLSGPDKASPTRAEMYDTVRYSAPHLGASLAKVRAECRGCEKLIVGWALLVVATPFFLIWEYAVVRIMSTEGILVLLILALLQRHRGLDSHLLRGLINCYRLVMGSPAPVREAPGE